MLDQALEGVGLAAVSLVVAYMGWAGYTLGRYLREGKPRLSVHRACLYAVAIGAFLAALAAGPTVVREDLYDLYSEVIDVEDNPHPVRTAVRVGLFVSTTMVVGIVRAERP